MKQFFIIIDLKINDQNYYKENGHSKIKIRPDKIA